MNTGGTMTARKIRNILKRENYRMISRISIEETINGLEVQVVCAGVHAVKIETIVEHHNTLADLLQKNGVNVSRRTDIADHRLLVK